MPDDVHYEAVGIKNATTNGDIIRSTPTLMVFVDNQLKHTASGLLRGDRLQAFHARWGFSYRNEDDQPNDADLSDDLNPWSNPRRWERGPVRDRIDDAKTRFAWWLLAKWLGFAGAGLMAIFPWLLITRRSSQNRTHREESRRNVRNRQTVRRKRPGTKR
ncbi:hypothetical protein LOC71_19425 [Rhodopirellula sp. JC740]|uniref:Uncharacterized protein n=1 Tax=Rhodopirellula halodulae TaxID=2894198 RepID=A0ABS8NLK7_9BACT|nr:hypothetical protein [Rhodopirellula sp. JC740]MCC9644448.1 hypothetical protein [Rhodopirellula sp. JC740]